MRSRDDEERNETGFRIKGRKEEHTTFFSFRTRRRRETRIALALHRQLSLGKEEKMRLLMMEAQRH